MEKYCTVTPKGQHKSSGEQMQSCACFYKFLKSFCGKNIGLSWEPSSGPFWKADAQKHLVYLHEAAPREVSILQFGTKAQQSESPRD